MTVTGEQLKILFSVLNERYNRLEARGLKHTEEAFIIKDMIEEIMMEWVYEYED